MPRYFLLIALMLIGCSESEAPKSSAKSAELPVIEAETIVVSKMDWPRIVRSQGSLFPDEVATLGIKVEGRVVDVHVDLGDVVSAGEPLVTVYQDDFKLMVDQAEAQLRQARSAVGLKPDDPIEKLQPVNAPPVKEQRALWDEATANLRRADELLAQNAIVRAEY
ncbi:MAG TPA: hypothetical protein DD473_27180, partial [Planctomycetaceae bacterium]|nr:hypothetical protein [Planctomycetaceae bacterium]